MQRSFRLIAERRPTTPDQLYQVSGMSEQKMERFGDAFLEVLRDA